MASLQKFIFTPDKHWGWEIVNGVKRPLHNLKAINAMLEFAKDFKPNVWIEGGDDVDFGPISHWNRSKKLSLEGLRLEKDMTDYDERLVIPVEKVIRPDLMVKLTGNHEDWANQFADEHPALAGLVDLNSHLELVNRGWKVLPQGGVFKLGKLMFTHGDTVTGGEHVAKAAVTAFEGNIRFGHHHTYQTYTKHSAVDVKQTKTGIAVPCMCHRGPGYGKKKPNRWVTGFNFGYINTNDGTFTDYIAVIVDGRFSWNGKVYKG